MRTSFILAFLFLALPHRVSAEDWTFLYKEDGIEVFTDHASPPTFRAEGPLNVDIVDILAVFADIPRRSEWVRNLKESRAIVDTEDYVLVYSHYNLPWPASDRDSLIESSFKRDYANSELTISFKAIESTEVPVEKGRVRVPKADGTLFLKILKKGETFVRYEVQLDPGGWLPQWICNFFVKDAPIDMLKAMRRRIADKKDLYAEFTAKQRNLWYKED
jgi:hypothetical protein